MVFWFAPVVSLARMQAFDGSAWQNLEVESSTHKNLRVAIFQNGLVASIINQEADGRSASTQGLATGGFIYGFNGSTWDRIRTHYLSEDFNLTATGTTTEIDLLTGFKSHTWTVIFGGTVDSATIKFQGSIDGTNWFDLDEYTGTSNTMRHVVNKAVRYIRFNVTDLSGTSPSVTLKYFGMRD